MRTWHHYLGFFLAGIMAMYAISGIVLIFRTTDFLKQEKVIEKVLPSDTKPKDLGKQLRIRDFKVGKIEDGKVYFKQGVFDTNSCSVRYTEKRLPFVMEKLTHLHKATTRSPLFFLNVAFGLALFFFVVSAFWMYIPAKKILRKGIYFSLGGLVLMIIMLFL